MAPAEGDGGGSTTPAGGLSLAGVTVLLPAESREDDSPVALPRSELSLGIWTFSCGRFEVSAPLFVREGGLISAADGIDCGRGGSEAVPVAEVFELRKFSWGSGFNSWFPCPGGES